MLYTLYSILYAKREEGHSPPPLLSTLYSILYPINATLYSTYSMHTKWKDSLLYTILLTLNIEIEDAVYTLSHILLKNDST